MRDRVSRGSVSNNSAKWAWRNLKTYSEEDGEEGKPYDYTYENVYHLIGHIAEMIGIKPYYTTLESLKQAMKRKKAGG